eukprot:1029118-Prorocentrum_minimum.AAC.1
MKGRSGGSRDGAVDSGIERDGAVDREAERWIQGRSGGSRDGEVDSGIERWIEDPSAGLRNCTTEPFPPPFQTP